MTVDKAKILVVDDDKMIHKLVGVILQKAGYEVLNAYLGQEGLDMARGHKPDLVILDIVMPGMNGFEVMQALKAEPLTAEIPVIFLSGKTFPTDKMQARDLGASDFIEKPFDRNELLARVKAYIKMSRQKADLDYVSLKVARLVEEGLGILHRRGGLSLEGLPSQLTEELMKAASHGLKMHEALAAKLRRLLIFAQSHIKGVTDESLRRTLDELPVDVETLGESLERLGNLAAQFESLAKLAESPPAAEPKKFHA